MEISQHYPSFSKRTLIVVTNNELARIASAFEREIEEIDRLEVTLEKPHNHAGGGANSAPPDMDAMKEHNQRELYKQLSEVLLRSVQKGTEEIILCAPEIHKNTLLAAMHTDVQKCLKDIVPKNLASLPLDQIIRILNEHK